MQISSRWNLLKGQFSLSVEKGERVSASRTGKRERGIWQRRLWAHLTPIKEISTGMSNIDWNPVKHGKARQASDWPYSSFHHYVKLGVYPSTWGYAGEFDFDRYRPTITEDARKEVNLIVPQKGTQCVPYMATRLLAGGCLVRGA
jgi:hypothetical protein